MKKIEFKKNWKGAIEVYLNDVNTGIEIHDQMRKYGYYIIYNENEKKRFYTLKETKDYIKGLL